MSIMRSTQVRLSSSRTDWEEAKTVYDEELERIEERLRRPNNNAKPRSFRATSNDEFAAHLLEVHRHCRACPRPGFTSVTWVNKVTTATQADTTATSRFLHTKKSMCVDQSTQTMPDVYSCSHCGSSPPTKPMPPLARIQPSGPQQIRLVDRIGNPLFNGPKTPNIKVIKIKKSTAGVLRRESGMTPQALKNLMQISSNLEAAQPLQGTLTGSSQSPARRVIQVQSQGLLTAQSQTRQLQLQRVEPVLMSLSNPASSGLPSDALTTVQKLSTPAFSSPSEQNIIHDSNITASSTLVDPLSVINIHGNDVPGSSLVVKREPVESMEDLDLEFSQAKCIDEKDNTEDYIYDDGSMTLDDEKGLLDPDKKLSEATDHPVRVIVKEEVLSDSERSNSMHSDTGWCEEEKEEKDEEDEEEEDEMEADEEIDYEAQERLDPSYDPSSSMPQHSVPSKNSKDKPGSSKDEPGSSKAKSSKCLGDQDSLESDDSLEYGGDSDEDYEPEGTPANIRKKYRNKNRKPAFKFPEACPICSEAWNEKPEIMRHLQTHVPIDKGPEAIKDAVQSIKSKFAKGYSFDMGWCGECKKLLLRFRTHFNRCHTKNPRYSVLCQQCGKMIKSSCIKMHEISHLEIKESDYVQCPQCPSRVKHQEYLRGHINKFHSNKARSAQCSTCGKILKNREHLRRHLVIHSGVKPYPCSMCDKSFTQSSNLNIHMRQHTGHKPYVCEFCEMAFTNKVSLKNHKKKLHGIDWWKERESLKKEERNKSDGSE